MDTLMKYVNRISRCAILYRSGKLENEGLNGYQHSYIMKICQNPGISQEQLAKIIYINKSNVTRQLALLEQNGFITRVPGEKDKRVMRVFPTQRALDLYPKVKSLALEWNEYLTADLTQEERGLLFSMLEQIMEKAMRRVEQETEKAVGPCEK